MAKSKTVGLTDNVVDFALDRCDVCKFCEDKTVVPQWRKKIVHHLVVTIDSDGHLHVHGPLNNKAVVERMIDCIAHEMNKCQQIDGNNGETYEVK